jgi:hypothetical protein
MANAVASAAKASFHNGSASDPQVITDLILRAVRANKPKTRYAAGKYAKPLMFARKWFGDRIFDKMVLAAMK